MKLSSHNRLVSFIWSITDDCLRDVLLEPSKDAVMEELAFQRAEAGTTFDFMLSNPS